jgi:hypothetical protein
LVAAASALAGACSSTSSSPDGGTDARDATVADLASESPPSDAPAATDTAPETHDATTLPDVATTDADASSPAPRCTALEPADEPALAQLADWFALPSFRPGKYLQVSSTDRGALPEVDANNYVCPGTGVAAVPDAGAPPLFDQPACAESYVKGYVAARVEGSGRLARFWLTGMDLGAGGLVSTAVLRIYVDDEEEPCISLKVGEAKRPPAALEIFAAPFGANLETNLAWYYPVVFSKKLIVTLDVPNNVTWYQADFVMDEQPTTHARAQARLSARDGAKAQLGGAAPAVAGAAPLTFADPLALATGVPVTTTLVGAATITSFRVRVPTASLSALSQIAAAITWDDAATPAVAMSLADLFAVGQGLSDAPSSSLALAITKAGADTTLDLRLPMPFSSKAVITLTNAGPPTTVSLFLDGKTAVPAAPWGHLTVVRSETTGPTTLAAHPIVSVTGKGRLAGTCLLAQGHASALAPPFLRGPTNFLEGDEQLVIDGRAMRGTGAEDYFDSAFYFDPPAGNLPFAQWGAKSETTTTGKVTACRWHVLGAAIDFKESLDLSLEIGLPDPATLDRYVTTAFVYR